MSRKELANRLTRLERPTEQSRAAKAPPWVRSQGPEAVSEWLRKGWRWQAIWLPDPLPADDSTS